MPSHRAAHYAVLAAVWAVLGLPNLGGPSLWDMDEGVNTECTREMWEAEEWVVPTFNWELRSAKPVLMYWFQRLSFDAFGVSEWSARVPSALFGLATVLVVYETGRRMFGPGTGLLAGLALGSAIQFVVLSHAATPDAPLVFFTTLTLLLFWAGHADGGRRWFYTAAAASGGAVLAKGPVGLALPGLAVLLYLAWNRELGRLLDRRLVWGGLVFLAVAGPWYALVAVETRGEWPLKFIGYENLSRFGTAMEGHRGPVFYYAAAVLVLFAPWSCVIGATFWYGAKASRRPAADGLSAEVRAHRLLLCWFGVYLVFFSLAATKLPNYIAPLYPAAALLTARFLTRWRSGELAVARWVMPAAVGGVALTGAVAAVAMVLVSGVVPLKGVNPIRGLEWWAATGVVPLAAAAVMGWGLRAANRPAVVSALTAGAVVMVGLLAVGPPAVVDRYKSAKELVRESGANQPDRDIRLAAVGYFQESLVFYSGRKVQRSVRIEVPPGIPGPRYVDRPFTADDAAEFLSLPRAGYLFVPEKVWREQVQPKVTGPVRVAARRYDLLKNTEILVVTNEVQ